MDLHYKKYGQGSPLIILHGLFGMGDNWRTFAREAEVYFTVYLVDLRNHGRSPHSPDISFALMAEDVRALMSKLELTSAAVLGHSMGGKVAMTLALEHPTLVEKLVVVDIAPRAYQPHHQEVLRALTSVTAGDMETREGVEARLSAALSDSTVVQFLMKSLGRAGDGSLVWKANMPAIIESYPEILKPITSPRPFEGPTAFIRGQRSAYVQDADRMDIQALFPRAEMMTIPDAGHWVHADQPQLFARDTLAFLNRSNF